MSRQKRKLFGIHDVHDVFITIKRITCVPHSTFPRQDLVDSSTLDRWPKGICVLRSVAEQTSFLNASTSLYIVGFNASSNLSHANSTKNRLQINMLRVTVEIAKILAFAPNYYK